MNKLLIGVDESAESRHAIEVAFDLFGSDAEYTIASIAETRPMFTSGYSAGAFVSPSDLVDRFDAAERLAHERAEEAAGTVPSGVDVDVDATVGHAGSALCETAVDIEADAIVIGSHDKSVWERLLNPSTGRYLIDHAPCPVVVVR